MKSSTSKHKSRRPSERSDRTSRHHTDEAAWSEPKWHDEYQQWYKERSDRRGHVQYEWIGPELVKSTPRTAVDALAQGVENLDVNQDDGFQQDSYGTQSVPVDDPAVADFPTSPEYTTSSRTERRAHDRKGRSHEEEEIPYGGASQSDPHYHASDQAYIGPEDPGYDAQSYPEPTFHAPNYAGSEDYGTTPAAAESRHGGNYRHGKGKGGSRAEEKAGVEYATSPRYAGSQDYGTSPVAAESRHGGTYRHGKGKGSSRVEEEADVEYSASPGVTSSGTSDRRAYQSRTRSGEDEYRGYSGHDPIDIPYDPQDVTYGGSAVPTHRVPDLPDSDYRESRYDGSSRKGKGATRSRDDEEEPYTGQDPSEMPYDPYAPVNSPPSHSRSDYRRSGPAESRHDASSRKGKGKSRTHLETEAQRGADYRSSRQYTGDDDAYRGAARDPPLEAEEYPSGRGRSTGRSSRRDHAQHFQERNFEDVEEEGQDDALAEAIRQSKRTAYYGEGDASSHASSETYAAPSTSYQDEPAYDYNYNYDDGGQDNVPTPRAGSPARLSSNYIGGTGGDVEEIDNRYRMEPSWKFSPGQVFKILWAEPTGASVGVEDPISDTQKISAANEKFYVGYRRFIVVATDDGHHSTCVPVLTYDRRGCNKKGVKPQKHGIIYGYGHKPRPLPKEPELGFPPVAVRLTASGEKLAPQSRVNYSKLVTIEHNVKVFFIGSIDENDFETVRYAVNSLWAKKMTEPKKHRK